MNGLPDDLDLSFLDGTTLLQVCVGENEVILNLDPGVSIMVASDVRFTTTTGVRRFDNATDIGTGVLRLLGHSVVKSGGERDGTLSMTWDTGETLQLLDTWKEFESYTIRHRDRIIVV